MLSSYKRAGRREEGEEGRRGPLFCGSRSQCPLSSMALGILPRHQFRLIPGLPMQSSPSHLDQLSQAASLHSLPGMRAGNLDPVQGGLSYKSE